MNSVEALVALEGEVSSAEESDIIEATAEKLQTQLSLMKSMGDTGDVVVYAGGDWERSDGPSPSSSPPTVTIAISTVLTIFERFAVLSSEFTKHVQMHGVPPPDPVATEAPVPHNFKQMAALLAQEGG